MAAPANYTKLGPQEWGLISPEPIPYGVTVDVFVKSTQAIKQEKVGENVPHQGRGFLYRIIREPKPAAADREEALGDVSKLFALFDTAKGRFPALFLTVPGLPTEVRLSLAGPQSKYPGALQIKEAQASDTINGEPGNRHWYGRLMRDGTLVKAKDFKTQSSLIAMQLRRLAANPVQVAREYGEQTDRCMFCRLTLSDRRSVATGYGETCAANRGLPWPLS